MGASFPSPALGGTPSSAYAGLSPSACLAKRTLDLLLAGLGLLLLSPLLASIAVVVRVDSPGPFLYHQIRRGQGDLTFRIYKFRTMTADADARLHEVLPLNLYAERWSDTRIYKIPNDPRVTRVGALLRRYSLDELPQLLNVLRGEMSMVGPRPLMLVEDRHVVGCAGLRRAVKPGLTGPWQVGGRHELSFDEMLKLDCRYVATWSFGADLRLILRTIPAVFQRQGAY